MLLLEGGFKRGGEDLEGDGVVSHVANVAIIETDAKTKAQQQQRQKQKVR